MAKDFKINSKRYKFVYDREKHKKDVAFYSDIPYKDHFILEIFGINKELISSSESSRELILRLREKLNFKIIHEFFYQFQPGGITGVLILSQSHLAIHTWPEFGYVHIDLMTCSEEIDFSNLERYIEEIFKPEYYEIAEFLY